MSAAENAAQNLSDSDAEESIWNELYGGRNQAPAVGAPGVSDPTDLSDGEIEDNSGDLNRAENVPMHENEEPISFSLARGRSRGRLLARGRAFSRGRRFGRGRGFARGQRWWGFRPWSGRRMWTRRPYHAPTRARDCVACTARLLVMALRASAWIYMGSTQKPQANFLKYKLHHDPLEHRSDRPLIEHPRDRRGCHLVPKPRQGHLNIAASHQGAAPHLRHRHLPAVRPHP